MLQAINNFNDRNEQNSSQKIEELQNALQEKTELINRLKALIEVNSIITSSLDRTKVLKNILDQTKLVMKCKRSSILLVDFAINKLKFHAITNEEEKESLQTIRLKMGEGIAGSVWQHGKPILIDDCKNDPRFTGVVDEKCDFVTNSIIAVPLAVNGKIIGVMEAINKINDTFTMLDLEILSNLSVQAAIAIENAHLYEMAINDGMTELFIHRYFIQRLNEEFNRSKRYGNDLSLIFFDIDHFKKINDTYGHQAGDEVLKKIAYYLKNTFRSTDIVCRYGGEEFAIIMPNSGLEDTYACVQRTRQTIGKMKFIFQDAVFNVTISGGIASIKTHYPSSEEEFIQMADKALYNSKSTGRNQVSIFQQE